MEWILFVILAAVAVVSAAVMISRKNAVHSALLLILNFGCVALLFLMLDAPFISMVQIAVYAGAIMVLFLFVIMLLGAEQTTDTEARQFGWLTGAATALGVVFLVAMAIPLLMEGGLDLPDAPGEAPRLRLVHVANYNSVVEVEVEVEGEDLDEDGEPDMVIETQFVESALAPVDIQVGDEIFEDLIVNDNTSFTEFEAGDYDVVVTDSETGAIIFETALTLAEDDVVTLVIYGEYLQTVVNETVDTTNTLAVATIANNITSSGDDEARVNVLNLVTENPVYLVDLGRDRQLTVATGEDAGIGDAVLTDETLVYGETSAIVVPDGTFNIRFVEEVQAETYDVVSRIGGQEDWTFEEGTEQTLIFTPDYASNADQFGYRATVLEYELAISEPFGSPGDIGGLLFIDYLLPVNLVGFLLLVALVGVIVLTRPEGATASRRSTLNRRRKVSRPLVSVITEQTGHDVIVETPKLDEPDSGD